MVKSAYAVFKYIEVYPAVKKDGVANQRVTGEIVHHAQRVHGRADLIFRFTSLPLAPPSC